MGLSDLCCIVQQMCETLLCQSDCKNLLPATARFALVTLTKLFPSQTIWLTSLPNALPWVYAPLGIGLRVLSQFGSFCISLLDPMLGSDCMTVCLCRRDNPNMKHLMQGAYTWSVPLPLCLLHCLLLKALVRILPCITGQYSPTVVLSAYV